jgi:hypothetical protein
VNPQLHSTRTTEHGWSSYIASKWTCRKHHLHHLFYCCVTTLHTRKLQALHSNSCCLQSPLSNWSVCHIAPSLKPFVPKSYRHTAISSSLSAELAMSVISLTFLPVAQFFSVHSPTAPTAVSLRPLILSSSLIRCEPVQVYRHHPWPRFLWIMYTTWLIWVTTLYGPSHEEWSLSNFFFVWVGWWASFCRPCGNLHSCLVFRNEFSSGRWPASGVGRHNCGCLVDGPLNLPHDSRSFLFWRYLKQQVTEQS